MENIESIFCERLIEARGKKKLTQKALAELLGITPTRLNYWEKGKREPDVFMIKKLAAALDVTGDYLLGTEGYGANKKAPEITLDGKYERIIQMLDRLKPEQVSKVEGFIECMIMDNEAVETVKQTSAHLA